MKLVTSQSPKFCTYYYLYIASTWLPQPFFWPPFATSSLSQWCHVSLLSRKKNIFNKLIKPWGWETKSGRLCCIIVWPHLLYYCFLVFVFVYYLFSHFMIRNSEPSFLSLSLSCIIFQQDYTEYRSLMASTVVLCFIFDEFGIAGLINICISPIALFVLALYIFILWLEIWRWVFITSFVFSHGNYAWNFFFILKFFFGVWEDQKIGKGFFFFFPSCIVIIYYYFSDYYNGFDNGCSLKRGLLWRGKKKGHGEERRKCCYFFFSASSEMSSREACSVMSVSLASNELEKQW